MPPVARRFSTPVELPGDPASALHAATKQYVDNNAVASVTQYGNLVAEQSVTNSTTLVVATGMSVSLEANTLYKLVLFLPFSAVGTTPFGGFKAQLTVPTGAIGLWGLPGAASYNEFNVESNVWAAASSAAPRAFTYFGSVETVGTAGSMFLSFAQNAAQADESAVIFEGAYLSVVPVTGPGVALTGPVTSVNGNIGAVTLAALDVGAQPLDSDLTTIAGLSPADGTFMKRVSSAWAASTLVKGDVGLGNVDNTADTVKPVSTAQQTALNLKINLADEAVANGVATLDAAVKVPYAQLPTGSAVNTVAAGNDGRFPIFARCTAATTRNNSVVLTSITGMSCSLPVGTYALDGAMYYTSTDAADIAFRLLVSSGAMTGDWYMHSLVNTAVGQTGSVFIGSGSVTNEYSTAGGGILSFCSPRGYVVVTTAAVVAMQVKQAVATAVNTTVQPNSWLRFEKMA